MRSRNIRLWLPAYVKHRLKCFGQFRKVSPTDLIFCFVDHFEPNDTRRPVEVNDHVMTQWLQRYPRLCTKHFDSDNVPPQHTWFYPAEAYHAGYMDALSRLVRQRLGEIELHLHHANDDEASLRRLIEQAKQDFSRHGALITSGPASRFAYAFIHGNSALCNSRADQSWCGVNDELRVLKETGCYADFSFPTYPCESQPRIVNSIYYATSSPHYPRGHDRGAKMAVQGVRRGDLLLIQGPLALNSKRRKYALLPRVDGGDITRSNPGTAERIRLWVRQRIGVEGRPEWIFVKVSCHGATFTDLECLLGDEADVMHTALERLCHEQGWRLHYVTAREMFNIAKAAEAGETGNPNLYRNFIIPIYQNRLPCEEANRTCAELRVS